MNTHKMLADYHGQDNYPEIAQFAAGIARDGASGAEIMAQVLETFPRPVKQYLLNDRSKEYVLWGKDLIEQKAIDQLEMCLRIDPAIRGAGMPDMHPGYAMPIGGIVDLADAASPSYVGFDISCMVMYTRLEITDDTMTPELYKMLANVLRKVTHFGIGKGPGNADHKVMGDTGWLFGKAKSLKDKAAEQLGTSGGGNHFADIVVDDEGYVGLLTHSGSRGTGHKLATHYTKLAAQETSAIAKDVPSEHGWLSMSSDAGREYFRAMLLMGEYAKANHEIIHDRFMDTNGLSSDVRIWNRHNFIWDNGDGSYRHRKGATPSEKGVLGLIPGTSSTPSFIVEGRGQELSLNSSSHGAGRPWSRTQAKKVHDKEMYADQKYGIIHYSVAKDETEQAYKSIEQVMARQTDLVEIVTRLHPKVVIMGGKRSDDGD